MTEAEIQQSGAEYAETHCSDCGGYCPAGVLDNGKCSDCDLVGKSVSCRWGRFGVVKVKITKYTKNNTFYASRWNKKQKCWTIPKMIERWKDNIWKLREE